MSQTNQQKMGGSASTEENAASLPSHPSEPRPSQSRFSRRRFLRGVGAFAAGAPYILRYHTAFAQGDAKPSNRIAIACIGIGGQGGGLLGSLITRKDVQVVGVCDVDSKHRLAARARIEKAYNANGVYETGDFREIVARSDVDAVMIATPDHWHVLNALAAVRAGKDVYVEKPLTLTIAEGRVLSDEVRRYGRVLQVGSQQRSSSQFRRACELVRNGRIGKIKTVQVGLPSGRAMAPVPVQQVPPELDYNMWLGPAPFEPYFPERVHYNFRWILDYSGGQVTNFGAHDLDIVQWGLGRDDSGPVEVEGRGEFPADGPYTTPVRVKFQAMYEDGVQVLVETGTSGVRFEGEKGWVYVNRGGWQTEPENLKTSVLTPGEVHLYETRGHWENFLSCVRTRQQPICTAEIGHRTATFCHLANISMRLERKVRWNPQTEQIVGDPEAAHLSARALRAPWTL